MRSKSSLFVCLFLGAFLPFMQNCAPVDAGDPSDSGQSPFLYEPSNPSVYFQSSRSLTLEVYYEPGAEPYDGTLRSGAPLWTVLEENLDAIFQYRSQPPDLNVPMSLAEMTALPTQAKLKWEVQDVLELHERFLEKAPTFDEARFYVYFLNGRAASGDNVIGFNIADTPIIVLFKEVIEASGGDAVDRFVEQSTVVHEMGHALGLVNVGVPLASSHQDAENGAHTLNQDCVMYYLNEGANDLRRFVNRFVTNGNRVMWGPEVLLDAQSFSQ